MYGNYNIKDKELLIQKVMNFFYNKCLVEEYMEKVILNFNNSCQHNFTNPNMNSIAWLGQASVALCYKIPEDITRIAWNFLPEKIQLQSNKIAKQKIDRWKECQKNI